LKCPDCLGFSLRGRKRSFTERERNGHEKQFPGPKVPEYPGMRSASVSNNSRP
jgi:hypothetical protein